MTKAEIHNKLRENSIKIRNEMHFTQDVLAEKAGVSVDTIKRIERDGETYVPSSENLIKIGLVSSTIYEGLMSHSDDLKKLVHEEAIKLLELQLVKMKNNF